MLIHIPTPLRAFTNKQETIQVTGTTVAAGLEALVVQFPALRGHLFTPEGALRSFVNVYVNDEDVRYLPEKEHTGVDDAAELTIIPSIAGGSVAAAFIPADCTAASAPGFSQEGQYPVHFNPAQRLYPLR